MKYRIQEMDVDVDILKLIITTANHFEISVSIGCRRVHQHL